MISKQENEAPDNKGMCLECGTGVLKLQHLTYFTWLNNELITVPDFPAYVCDICGRREYDGRSITWLNTLLNPETREEYGEAISAGIKRTSLIPEAHAEKEVREALDAETLYQKGLVLLRRDQYDKALEFVDKARELNPNEGEYLATWAKIQSAQRDHNAPVEDLLLHLRRAEELAPKSERVHLYMGQLLKQINRIGEARTHFEMVLKVNPRNIEAGREVRIMEIRRSKEDKKNKGFFKRFLG